MKNGRTLIALTGCPNTGKTTIFNGLTGRNTPTGNWSGTTVEPAVGCYRYSGCTYMMADIPGADSLSAGCAWETLPRDFLHSGLADAVLVVCSAAALERGLSYLDRILRRDGVRQTGLPVVFCLNLWDEAEKRRISIDLDLLSDVLQIPVVPCCARSREDLDNVKTALHHVCAGERRSRFLYECLDFSPKRLARACCAHDRRVPALPTLSFDRVVTDPLLGKLFFLALMTALFWVTMVCSEPLSGLLEHSNARLETTLRAFLAWSRPPAWLVSCLVYGIVLPLAWVLPFILPPMAVFFPLLALAGETGLLPRAVFAMDRCLERCRACGRQCLSMAVGMGCSAAGVLNCRAISSSRQRLTAILTSSFIPCSGKFPLLAALALLFFTGFPACGLPAGLCRALILAAVFTAALGANLGLSRLLSRALPGGSSSFILELPALRRPLFGKVILGSLYSRVLLVMGRMAAVTLPAGILIWICDRVFCPASLGGWFTFTSSGTSLSLLDAFLRLFEPLGRLMGLDAAILAAFLIALPANEAVLPLILTLYLQSSPIRAYGSLGGFLALQGWTWRTALCLMAFCAFHWPCLTTCRTIRRETGSRFWTAAAIVLPTLAGILLCMGLNWLLALAP